MFNFTPLLGAQSASTTSQSLLELDGGIKILVDVGWNEEFDADVLKELEKHVPTLSFILLTHATTSHLGAFAHCCKHIPLFARIPVYATEPVIALGRSLLQDIYTSTPLAASVLSAASLSETVYSYPAGSNATSSILLPPPSQIEIAGYFSAIHSLKYSQPFEPTPSSFSPPLNGLTITAYSAGRTLGGTIWHIQHGQESIVYAVDWSQAREHVLAGAAWIDPNQPSEVIESLRRPTALVTSSRGSQRVALTGGQRKRDEILLGLIKETIARGGTVLIPSDSSARVLELVYLLESAWAQASTDAGNTLNNAKLYFASSSGKSTLHNARRMLEWMDPNVQRQFENQANLGGRQPGGDGKKAGSAPFDLVFTKTVEKKGQINRALLRDGAKVVVASDTSLQWGFSRAVLETIALDENNLIILTERTAPISQSTSGFGKLLWDVWSQKAGVGDYDAVAQNPPSQAFTAAGAQISSRTAKIEALAGNELNVYQQYLARQRQMQNTVNTEESTAVATNVDVADAQSESSSESEDEDDDEQQGKALNATAAITHGRHKIGLTDAELGIDVLVRRKGHYDYDVRARKGRERMYPIVKKAIQRDDEYGDAIKAEDYLRAEERNETNDDEANGTGAGKEAAVGAKRKWDEVNAEAAQASRKLNAAAAKRKRTDDSQPMDGVQTNGAPDSDEEESDGEPEEKIEGPVKAVFEDTTLTLNLRVAFVDFSGYHDKRSILHLIPLIKPRKLILIAGEPKETASLSTDCEQILHLEPGNEDITTPLNGAIIDASVDTNAWTVKLSQPLYKKLRWQNVRGLGVVALSAYLLPVVQAEEADDEASTKKLKLTNGENPNRNAQQPTPPPELPLLDISTSTSTLSRTTAAQPIHVGDIRLADLRRALQAEQYVAEFRGEGLLVINNSVAVRKSATGRLEVEGLLGVNNVGRVDGTFWSTRRKVYDMLAVVSGA
jgi:cleavage and polyadenylation specificity factor subunit 2